MKIKILNFSLEPPADASDRFDLFCYSPGKTREGEPKTVRKRIGYAMTLESCADTIIKLTAKDRLGDNEVSLKQYIEEYRQLKEEVKQMLV